MVFSSIQLAFYVRGTTFDNGYCQKGLSSVARSSNSSAGLVTSSNSSAGLVTSSNSSAGLVTSSNSSAGLVTR